jgi:uncharacterized membrane protein
VAESARAAPRPLGWLAAFAAALLAMLALDALWIGWLARPLYLQGIGHLMADGPDLRAAATFYLVYAAGLVGFAVRPAVAARGVGRAALGGALFGAVAYATYDLTNLATLRGWPLGLSLIDIAWGTFASACASASGKAVLDRFVPHRSVAA